MALQREEGQGSGKEGTVYTKFLEPKGLAEWYN